MMKSAVFVFYVSTCIALAAAVHNDSKSKFSPSNTLSQNPAVHIEGRIAGGMLAEKHQFPYMAGLMLVSKDITWCGGALISNKFVLTAAHCLDRISSVILLLGSNNILNHDEGRTILPVSNTNFIIHPDYNRVTSENDIALVKLPKETEINEYIQTVNLPHQNQDQQTLIGKLGVITGWGQPGDHKNVSMDMRYATLQIAKDFDCRFNYPALYHSSQICVSGKDKKSVCAGDSGGPLVIQEKDDSKTVVGLVSFGRKEGCELGYPTIFTRVASYLDWISNHTGIVVK